MSQVGRSRWGKENRPSMLMMQHVRMYDAHDRLMTLLLGPKPNQKRILYPDFCLFLDSSAVAATSDG